MTIILGPSFQAKKYYYLARLHYVGTEKFMGNFETAMEYFRRSAECGNEMGRFQLGLMYYFGTGGVEHNPRKGVECFFQASQGGEKNATLFLGRCFQSGGGIEKDLDAAVKLYAELADEGFADGQVHLGRCYFHGVGVDKDRERAVELYRKAAEQGNSAGMLYLYQCYRDGTGVEKNEAKAEEWLKKYLEQTSYDEDDEPVFRHEVNPEEYAEAMKLFNEGAEMGDADCQYVLGFFYLFGDGVREDRERAKELLEKAAAKGQKDARKLLEEEF